ncbi:MAG: SMP-30/gluconolactonase/LRE family protein [Bryobacteraceae bacterium]|nr:SMP-30/gluconolactonase/LRE family protein [Bryobacteraceae bacterium]
MRVALAASTVLFLVGCTGNRVAEEARPATPVASAGSVVRNDPALDALIPKDAVIEKLAGDFQFTEGPLWRGEDRLWFSDVQGNVVREWSPKGVVEILRPAGYDGSDAPAGAFIGPNGMIAGKDGTVLLCQHGNRRIVTISADRKVSTLVDKFEGKRFNSPNDLVYRSDGSLYFTDPPYGLTGGDEDKKKELKFNGVFRYADGKVTLLAKDLTRPNGIALSPDEKTLYVANSDEKRKIWMRYDVQGGKLANPKVFADVTSDSAEGAPDGMKVDAKGNVYATGPGGIRVFSAEGKLLGMIKPTEVPANCNWGDDGRSLYMTARTGLYRIKLAVEGKKPIYGLH